MPMDTIAEAVKFIINHEFNKNRPCSTHLGPALTEEEIKELMGPVTTVSGVEPHEDLIQLYTTTDGIQMDGSQAALKDIWILPGYYLMSLEEAVDNYNVMIESADDDGQYWENAWFPFMSSGAGDFYFLDIVKGTVNECLRGEDVDVEAEFYTLADFFLLAVQNFSDGEFYMDEEGQLQEK